MIIRSTFILNFINIYNCLDLRKAETTFYINDSLFTEILLRLRTYRGTAVFQEIFNVTHTIRCRMLILSSALAQSTF